MGVVKKTCYTVKCDVSDCDSLCNQLEDYVGPLDGLTETRESAERWAREQGFIQISQRKWVCPDCAKRYGLSVKH